MYAIYINDHLWNSITQIFELSSLEIKLKLNDISTAILTLPTTSENCKYEYFKEYNKIKIALVEQNSEKIMFEGVVRWVSSNLTETKITLNCENFLLKKKVLYVDKVYSNQSISSILNDIVNHINSRDTWFVTLNCNIANLVTKDYKKKKNFLDILKDLAWDIYEFSFKNNILTFSQTIWEDKSSWSNIVLFEFDINTPESRTIRSAEVDYDSDNIANAVLWEDWESESVESISDFGRIEEWFSNWISADLVNERKNSIKELSIEPMTDNFFICNLWDVVKTYIEIWSDIMSYNSSLKVIEKSYKTWNLNTINIKLNTWKVKSLSLLETIGNLKTRVSSLEL